MRPGQRKRFKLSPEKAFGNLKPEAYREVNKEIIPKESLSVGTRMNIKDKQGNILHYNISVSDIKEDTVLLDLNHPLAGKNLYFDVTVLEVKNATISR